MPKPQIAAADAEGQVKPDPGHPQQKQAVSQDGVPAPQRAQKAIKKAQGSPQCQRAKQAVKRYSRGHPNSRLQGLAGRGSS